jgi:hypothetical protein
MEKREGRVRKEGKNELGKRREERRGGLDRKEGRRRYRAGRVASVSEGKERRRTGGVKQREGYGETKGKGRRVREKYWRERKPERVRSQYWRGKRWRNGRTARGYRVVDYTIGGRVVKRKPQQGERRRPGRRWRKRK